MFRVTEGGIGAEYPFTLYQYICIDDSLSQVMMTWSVWCWYRKIPWWGEFSFWKPIIRHLRKYYARCVGARGAKGKGKGKGKGLIKQPITSKPQFMRVWYGRGNLIYQPIISPGAFSFIKTKTRPKIHSANSYIQHFCIYIYISGIYSAFLGRGWRV